METDSPRSTAIGTVIAAAVAVGVLAAIALATRSAPASSSGDDMAVLAPPGVVAEADIPSGLLPLYHGAADNEDVFSSVPCYCGCMDMLGHRHLLDCFERPDGSGWESHALGCGVCLGEAQQVVDLLDEGADPDVIVAAVIDEWSDPYLAEE